MEDKIKTSIELWAMTLVFLVRNYKSQMIALLLKNGVTVPNGASDQQIATTMSNLLRVSKSFSTDLNNFIQNAKVLEVLTNSLNQNAQYFRMSGKAYFNGTGSMFDTRDFSDDLGFQSQYGLNLGTTSSTNTASNSTKIGGITPPKKGFFSGLNFGELLNLGATIWSQTDKNKTDRAIADASKYTGGSKIEDKNEDEIKDKDEDKGISTTTIVVLSLVGVAVIGTIIYFVTRPKK